MLFLNSIYLLSACQFINPLVSVKPVAFSCSSLSNYGALRYSVSLVVLILPYLFLGLLDILSLIIHLRFEAPSFTCFRLTDAIAMLATLVEIARQKSTNVFLLHARIKQIVLIWSMHTNAPAHPAIQARTVKRISMNATQILVTVIHCLVLIWSMGSSAPANLAIGKFFRFIF